MKAQRWMVVAMTGVFLAGWLIGQSRPDVQAQPGDRLNRDGMTPAERLRERLEINTEKGVSQLVMHFPDANHPQRTTWRLRLATEKVAGKGSTPRENLVLREAYFQPSPERSELKILGMTHLAETMVCYSSGTRYYDIGDEGSGLVRASDSDLGSVGLPVTPDKKLVAELRDRGLGWKAGRNNLISRRAEELVLWSIFRASNYLYIIQFSFRDDGSIAVAMGSTGSNINPKREHNHMHLALWRIDVDLGDYNNNSVQLVRHREPWGNLHKSTQIVEPFNAGIEGFADCKPEEFSNLRILCPGLVNPVGNPVAYDLYTPRTGLPRHFGPGPDSKLPDEAFTRHDYYVLPFRPSKENGPDEMDCSKLLKYVQQGRKVENSDVVIWHITSAQHTPRDEDLQGPADNRHPGSTCILWSGFELRPRDLFASTPFYPQEKLPEKKTAQKEHNDGE